MSARSLRRTFLREVARSGLPAGPPTTAPISEADLAPLPAPAQRYLRFMGVLGRPRDWSFRLGLAGRFRPRREGGWQPVRAWQYNAALEVARIFHMDIRMLGLPVRGRDVYLRGRGSLVIRPLDLFSVSRYAGPEFDLGELVTWLNDAVLLAPSFLLSPRVAWAPVGDAAFNLALTDAGHTVTARVFLDGRGAVRDFSTDDRFFLDTSQKPARLVRTRWSTPVAGWREVDGRQLPTGGQAVWHFEEGDFAYADFDFTTAELVFNVTPVA